jgi:hypothetical protein
MSTTINIEKTYPVELINDLERQEAERQKNMNKTVKMKKFRRTVVVVNFIDFIYNQLYKRPL